MRLMRLLMRRNSLETVQYNHSDKVKTTGNVPKTNTGRLQRLYPSIYRMTLWRKDFGMLN